MTEPVAKPATPEAAQVAPPKEMPPVAAPTIKSDMNVPAPTGTKRWLGVFSPYKLDIQQGNFVSHEMAAKLKEDMTKEQVRFLLGVPLLTDMFHANRWDYMFRLQKANGMLTTNRLTIHFKDNRVVRFESSQLPGEVEYISHISGSQPQTEKPKAATETKPEAK